MHQTRMKDYKRGWKNYRSLNPYFRIKKRLERLPKGRRRERRYPDPQDMVYAEVDNNNFNKRYKYTTFAKSQDRRMFRAVPRKIAFLYGNKFLLKDTHSHTRRTGSYQVNKSLNGQSISNEEQQQSEEAKKIMQDKRRKADEQHRKHMGKLYKGSKFEKYFTN